MIAERFMDETAKEEYLRKLDYGYMKRRMADRDAYDFVVEMRDNHGERRVKRLKVFYISRELGRVGMVRSDVTELFLQEQRQKADLEAALTAAESANAAKSDFLSRMSHEIRTPMNAIIGMSAIAAQSAKDNPRAADCLSKIDVSSRFLLALINDILDMSRIESGKLLLKSERIPTEEFLAGVNAICRGQASAKGVEYECIADPLLDGCYVGDSMKLKQVLVNIISNAVKFTKKGGKVTFSAKLLEREKNNAALRFVVRDTGIGMSGEFMSHLFEPFSQEYSGATSLYGGTGLGLAISKNIVDRMDGKISVRSAKGAGTEFTVDVRLGVAKEPLKPEETAEYDFAGRRLLLAEDNFMNTEVALMLLADKGFAVETAENGLRALELFQQSEKGHFDAILMDIRMPVMDGLTAASQIRRLSRADAGTVPIIAMTANAFDEDMDKSRAAGMNAHLTKPIEPDKLYRTLYDLICGKEE